MTGVQTCALPILAKYLNGYETTPIVSPVCIIDTKQPQAQLRVSDKVFGAGSKSTITINEAIVPKTLAAIPAWTGRIYASGDTKKAVREYSLGEFPPETISWDGLDDSGKLVPDGSEFVSSIFTPKALNILTVAMQSELA